MAKILRSSLGSFISANGDNLSEQILLRISKQLKTRLVALLPDSGDRMDFIRAAIAEKLERSKQEI